MLMRIAHAGGKSPGVRKLVIEMHVACVRIGLDVVVVIVDVQVAGIEGHEVVHVAAFVEVVQAQHVVEFAVDGLAEQLNFLRELALALTVRDFLHGLGQAVQIGADGPSDLAPAGDRLQLHVGAQVPVERGRSAHGFVLGKTRATRVSAVYVSGLRIGEVPVHARGVPGEDQAAGALARGDVHVLLVGGGQ